MVAQDRATLKAEFETGDVPDGTDYGNLIDSFISITDTSAQAVASPISFAGSAAFTSTVTAATARVLGGINVSGAVTAGSVDVLGALRVSAAASLEGAVNIVGALTVVTAETTTGVTAATAAVTAPASAVKALKVTVSGNTYAILLYNVV